VANAGDRRTDAAEHGRPPCGGTLRILWDPETFDAFENIDGLVLSKEVLSFWTFGGLSFEEF